MTLAKYKQKTLVIFSRDRMKQQKMAKPCKGDEGVSLFIMDMRDKDYLTRLLKWFAIAAKKISNYEFIASSLI